MKREIKFKFWLSCVEKMTPPHTLEGIMWNIEYNVGGCTALQYTGLQDKHGADIYEGDIVYISDIALGNLLVKYSDGGFKFFINNVLVMGDEYDERYICNAEIVGNIFENPELWEHNKQKDI